MSDLFPKVQAVKLSDQVVKQAGGDRKLIEALKARLDERLIEQAKEMGIRNTLPTRPPTP